MNRLLRIAALLYLGFAAHPVGAADEPFAAGAAAYDGGRYAEAMAVWLPLARAGDVRAQIAVAGLLRSGIGGRADPAAAADWYGRAARAGDPIAQLNYAEMLRDGIGIARDRAAARVWFDRAARQGNAWAARQRDALDRGATATPPRR